MHDESSPIYFGDADERWHDLSPSRREAVERLREMLRRLRLPFALPEGTTTTYDEEDGTVHLTIRHATDNTMVALLVFANGLSLHWPGGMLRAPAWDEALSDTLEALLTGHNLIRHWRKAGTTTMVTTEVWLPGKVRRVLPRLNPPGPRAAVLRRAPWLGAHTEATLSYLRSPALAPPLESALF